jgi:hypothetical protein
MNIICSERLQRIVCCRFGEPNTAIAGVIAPSNTGDIIFKF